MSEFFGMMRFGFLESLRSRNEMFWELIFPIFLLVIYTSVSFESSPPKVYAPDLEIPPDYRTVSDPNDADVVLKLSNGVLKVNIHTNDSLLKLKINSLVWKIKSELERGGVKRSVEVDMISVGKSGNFDYKFYVFTGVVTLMIFATGLFVPTRVLTLYRENGILKFLKTTPLSKTKIVVALISSGTLVSLIGIVLAMFLAKSLGISYSIHVPTFMFGVLSGLAMSTGIGVAVGLAFKNHLGARSMASLLYTFMPFFSGVYFPVEFLPKFLRIVAKFIPMTFIVEIIRSSFERL